MKVQSLVIIERAELNSKAWELSVRHNQLVREIEAQGDPTGSKIQELHETDAVMGFIQRELLKEEEVKPKDYGIRTVHIG